MKNFAILLTFSFADYIFDRKSGVIFKELDDIYVFDSEIPRDIAIMVNSPRKKFRDGLNLDCGDESTGLLPKPDNFFGLNSSRITTESEFCTKAFDTFDQIVLSYIGSDLQFTERYNRTFDKLISQQRARRVRRNPAAIGGVAVVATGGYTWYVDSASRGRDEEIRQEVEHERQRITQLENVVELVKDELDLAVKKIRRSNAPIITWGGIDIPADEEAIKEILEGEVT
ncbi:Oidioi.mRNA.OKI2018_I69.PAR.g9966.t1.cds [Oikopleura dioica]|uniref:Oidioi.mRNA.OKI2018_I69.PAR.g9966.t1.cds n=1 Tax=Oikopleura dioica TaxID=34765 RepID=A0ABN7RTI6_OIKDI|nr:Oidioi.mRNA.OKI2018_I69.PAR.g9966.t1.cds [Oikopleura dioica]